MTRLASTVQASQYGATNNAGRRRTRPQPIVLIKGPAQGLEHTNDRALDAVQRRVADASGQARAFPLADSNVIAGLTLVSGTALVVEHGLGRAFRSAILAGQSAAGSIHIQRPSAVTRPPSQSNILDAAQITITPNFSGVADLLVW